jgi:glycosyltransferase involved in cell wall biosynthesis
MLERNSHFIPLGINLYRRHKTVRRLYYMEIILFTKSISGIPSGGHLYNNHLISELKKHCSLKTVRTIDAVPKDRNPDGILVDTILLLDPVFFDLVMDTFSSCSACLLTHWLPWMEREYLPEEGLDGYLPFGKQQSEESLRRAEKFNHFIVPSDFCGNAIRELKGDDAEICTAPPGIESYAGVTIKKLQKKQPVRFVSAANWIPVKGLHRLVPVLEDHLKFRWEWHLIGNKMTKTPYGKYLAELFRQSPVSERLIFHKPLPHREFKAVIPEYTCALVPSVLETYGIFAAEALASGIGLIASGAGGLREAAGYSNRARLCKNNSDWHKAIDEVLQNPLEFRTLTGEKYPSWKETMERIIQFLKTIF